MTLLLVLLLTAQGPVGATDTLEEAPQTDEGVAPAGLRPAPAPAPPPVVDGDASSAHAALRVPGCRVHAPARLDRAEACYRAAIDRTPDEDAERVAVLLALADAAVALRLHQQGAAEEGPPWLAAVTSGTVEMVGFSVVGGAVSAALFTGAAAVALTSGGNVGSQVGGLLSGAILLSPVVGAAAGGALSLWPLVAGARVTAGDAGLVRSGWVLGAANAVLLQFVVPGGGSGEVVRNLVAAGALMTGGAGLGAAGASSSTLPKAAAPWPSRALPSAAP